MKFLRLYYIYTYIYIYNKIIILISICLNINISLHPIFFHLNFDFFCLRLPVASSDGFCPLCDDIADRFGDYARSCLCGGDRSKRHNRLRNVLAACASIGFSLEVEEAELFFARVEDSGACEGGAGDYPCCSRPSASARQMSRSGSFMVGVL